MTHQNVTSLTPAPLSNDFTVDKSTGEAFISQRKLAELINVNPSTLMNYVSREHPKANTSKGISDSVLFSASTYFAYESKVSTQEAKDLLKKIGSAGAKAFIYDQSGFKMKAEPKPMTPNEILLAQAKFMVEQDKINERNEQRLKAIEAKQSAQELSESEFTVLAFSVYAESDPVDIKMANSLGRRAAKYCREHGYPIGKQKDPRFGRINSYPEHVLIEIFKRAGLIPTD